MLHKLSILIFIFSRVNFCLLNMFYFRFYSSYLCGRLRNIKIFCIPYLNLIAWGEWFLSWVVSDMENGVSASSIVNCVWVTGSCGFAFAYDGEADRVNIEYGSRSCFWNPLKWLLLFNELHSGLIFFFYDLTPKFCLLTAHLSLSVKILI